ncbi:MAG: glycosyl hydrolase 115 family protein [Treponema sp.]|nr:glycosyl hydrolase 115 family protein [Treponema sp.]
MKISNLELAQDLCFVSDEGAFPGVKKIGRKVMKDVERVFGFMPAESHSLADVRKDAVVFGSVDRSQILDELEKTGKIDLAAIRGKWEVFGFFVVKQPFADFPNVQEAIVIAGSDKRGTIYGLFHISELLGVSPLVDFSDVLPARREEFDFTPEHSMVSREPSVKYRGFFINDEWPAFGNWSLKRFGGPNALCYEHVFEMLLRMKGNYLWPAMWSAVFSWDGPGLKNAELADEYGVVMGTSHHEPCCRAGEEHRHYRNTTKEYGDEWNFQHCREGITRFWRDGLRRNRDFENIYTIGMRGECDSAILGREATLKDNIDLLKDVLVTQYALMKDEVNPNLYKIPRLLVMFSEVDKFYFGTEDTPGLKDTDLLDGVTIMMTDDNYGILRALPDESMRKHKGGLGLYYHFDFHGGPHCYEWVNENYLPRAWEQLTAAYEWGIRDVWIVNVGDMGLLEFPLNYFMDMAYDYDKYGSPAACNTQAWTHDWLYKQFAGWFVEKDMQQMERLVQDYTSLMARCRTERLKADTYDPTHFGEADELFARSEEIIRSANELLSHCPQPIEGAFWELVYYSAVGSANVSRLWIASARNQLYARQNRAEANDWADKVAEYLDFDQKLTDSYHAVDGGRFYGFGLSEHIGFDHWNDEDDKKPPLVHIYPSKKPRLIVNPEDREEYLVGTDYSEKEMTVQAFMNPARERFAVHLAPSNESPIPYTLASDSPWLSLSHEKGTALHRHDTLVVTIDRKKLAEAGGRGTATVSVDTAFSHMKLHFPARTAESLPAAPADNSYYESEGYISMLADRYSGKHDAAPYAFTHLAGYGRTASAMKVLPAFHAPFTLADKDIPWLEYTFFAEAEGVYTLEFYFSPTNPPKIDNVMEYAVALNGEQPRLLNMVDKKTFVTYFSDEWIQGAEENIQKRRTTVQCRKGANSLRFWALCPTLVLEKLVLFPEGMEPPASYLGPTESYRRP